MVAVIGPQSSGIAHVISHVVNELHVPLLSFGATDPTLSALQFPYFLRTTHSDYSQMHAIADLVQQYRWNEVIAIFVDDDYGRNGISALGDALAEKRAKISYKAALTPGASRSDINNLLADVNLMESRVYVVHVNPDTGLTVFSEAEKHGMLASGYVWIATDWLPSVLDLSESVDRSICTKMTNVVIKGNQCIGFSISIPSGFIAESSQQVHPLAEGDLLIISSKLISGQVDHLHSPAAGWHFRRLKSGK